jgi:PAS domain S-box-containing protein
VGERSVPETREALFEQREWLRVTLASIGDAVITTDTGGNVTFLNPVAESLTGWTQEHAIGKPLTTVFHIVNETSRKHVESPTVRALREGVVVGLANHTVLISRDGTERPIDDSAAPIRRSSGEVAGVVLVFRDITERRAAEQVHARLAAIIDSSDDAIISKTLDGFIVTWNAAAERLLGYTAAEVVGRPIAVVIPPERSEEEPRILQQLQRGERVDHFETVRLAKDGSRIDVSLTISTVKDAEGKIIGASKIMRDIRDRKRSEQALKQSEVRYRRLFESARDGMLILDADTGRITDANPVMLRSLGCTLEELQGKELWQIGVLSDAENSRTTIHQLQKTGYIRYDHLPITTSDGQQMEAEVIANVYREDSRQVIQCNFRDITDRRDLERQAREQAKELADLHRRKDEFLAMLSHELRNPLAPILNAVQLLRLQQASTPLQKEAHDMIERQVGQLARLVDDLLEVSRITTGRIHLQVEQIDLRNVVSRAIETTKSDCGTKSQTVAWFSPVQPLWVKGDPMRLEQVVVNLLNNACKYTDRGGHIWVGLEQENDEVALRVRDNGIGIGAEMLPRIFDLFSQADQTLHRSQGGLGVGLALVKSLVTMHHGQVQVHSKPGEGSEFVVRLPRAQSPEVFENGSAERVEHLDDGLKILVVDDNMDAANSVAMLLRAAGHDARVAHDGTTALQAALEFLPRVAFLDIGMPGLDGFEVAKWIRQEPSLKNTVLVALTGYGQEVDRQRSQDAGFDHHLTKPANFAKIQQVLTTIPK